jgi:hypothetical protein
LLNKALRQVGVANKGGEALGEPLRDTYRDGIGYNGIGLSIIKDEEAVKQQAADAQEYRNDPPPVDSTSTLGAFAKKFFNR